MTATIHTLQAKREPSLDPLTALIAADMNGVNAVILDRMQSKVALIPELAGHLIAGGGIFLAAYQTCTRSSGGR